LKGEKNMKIRMILIVLFAVLFVTQTDAQYRDRSTPRATESSIGAGPQIGYQRSGDADAGRIMVGAFIRAKLAMALALDLSVNYRTEQYDAGIDVTSWPVLLSALVYPIPAVYGIAGVGWHFSTISYRNDRVELANLGDRTSSPFGFHLGAGLEIPLAQTVKLFGDIKYVFLDYDLDDVEDVRLGDLSSNFYLINVGLAFGLR
jgi:opacity protein-like surface antigen